MQTPHDAAEARPHPEACFDADWLALRAAADRAARAPRLEALAAAWLRARRQRNPETPLRLVDLGSGSGANPRHLAARLPGPQQWTLIDHDAGLLQRARSHCADLRDAEGAALRVDTRCLDLGALGLPALVACPPDTPAPVSHAGADLVCASALLDLMSAAWLARLAETCAQVGCALLITLSVDGSWRFLPRDPASAAADPDDAFVRDAFNAHQRRDKGLGAALGPAAAPVLAEQLAARGFQVETAASPWRLELADPAQAALARALIDGWRDAATAQCPQAAARIAAWHERRSAQCGGRGRGQLEVGHVDLFARPPTPALRPARPAASGQ
jgi:SAM-dependent methyltransferase